MRLPFHRRRKASRDELEKAQRHLAQTKAREPKVAETVSAMEDLARRNDFGRRIARAVRPYRAH